MSIAKEAMDKLLEACHSQSLNLFVESFLKMVQKLLECSDPEMQCLATTSVSSSGSILSTDHYHFQLCQALYILSFFHSCSSGRYRSSCRSKRRYGLELAMN